jgi:hypothetical protein
MLSSLSSTTRTVFCITELPEADAGLISGDRRWRASYGLKLGAIHFGKANMKPEKRGHLTPEAAENLAIEALSFVASDPELVSRFMALTGIEPSQLRSAAADPGFLVGVIDYYLGDESLLLAFAAHAGVQPKDIAAARRALAPEDIE